MLELSVIVPLIQFIPSEDQDILLVEEAEFGAAPATQAKTLEEDL